jgi:hypothetical protein
MYISIGATFASGEEVVASGLNSLASDADTLARGSTLERERFTASIEEEFAVIFTFVAADTDTPPGRGSGVCSCVAMFIVGWFRFILSAKPEESTFEGMLESPKIVEFKGSDILIQE